MTSPSRMAAIGPPATASGATCPAIRPRVAPEKRPSVSRATDVAEARAHDRRGHAEHLAHARTALGAFVADHDDVAGLDGAGLDGGEGRFLALEHPRRPLVPGQRRAGHLHHAALRRDVAVQHEQAAGGLERRVEGPHDVLSGRFAHRRGFFADACGR